MDTPSSALVSLSINRLEMSVLLSLTSMISSDDEEARLMRSAWPGPAELGDLYQLELGPDRP